MRKRHEQLFSTDLGRHVHLWCYGHWGAPLVAFPSAAGFAHEWDARGMVDALAPLINDGKIKLYCPETNISQSWMAKDDPRIRAQRHIAYEHFVLRTLAPWIRWDCQTEHMPIATAGCSLGGYYAALFALKHPRQFNHALCMSGRYRITGFTGGYSNNDIYFNNPLAFVPNLHGDALEHIRRHTHLTLVCGQGMWESGCIEETQELGDLLGRKRIPHQLDIWGHDSKHDWDWWRKQALYHLGRRFG